MLKGLTQFLTRDQFLTRSNLSIWESSWSSVLRSRC
jgi:hypothetical protein